MPRLPLKKTHILLGTKVLGTFFYDKDKENTGYLKLSFDKEISGFTKWTDVKTNLPVPTKVAEPTKLEVSYKFKDNFFAVKTMSNGKTGREFHQCSVPHTTSLFAVKVRDWNLLNDAVKENGDLQFDLPSNSNGLVVVFSFLGADGNPMKSPKYPEMMMVCTDLPEEPLNKFCIGIAPNQEQDFGDFGVEYYFPLTQS